jgi:hypothetical protein
MAPECESLFFLHVAIESRPLSHLRMTPIRPYHPPCLHFAAPNAYPFPRDPMHNGAPQKLNSLRGRRPVRADGVGSLDLVIAHPNIVPARRAAFSANSSASETR